MWTIGVSVDTSIERVGSIPLDPALEIHEFDEHTGYVVDAEKANQHGLKLAGDGHTILVPQPSSDTYDPLNWGSFKKHFILLVVSMCAFLPEAASTTGAVGVLPQAAIWRLSENEINHATSGNVFMIGAGGLFAVTLSAYFDRLPVLFWSLFFTLLSIIWCAVATSFDSYMAGRILNGFFAVGGEAGATMWINDMFFFHDKVRKVRIYVCFILNAVFIGPLLSAFMLTTQSWRTTFWRETGEVALCFCLVLLFFDESYYDRRLRPDQQPQRKTRLHRLVGVQQFQSRHTRNTLKEAIMRPIKAATKLTVLISFLYTFCTFAWFVGISVTRSIFLTPLYHFGLLQIGYMFFLPILGNTLGYVLGVFLHDWVAKAYIKRHQGRFEPEALLWSI
ncbi:uncharacterized protein PV07_08100 [Cladophialophora immunda]|uniref:Major facilitator superfamily (MFS) profile domain-containing protein n=1 Tax=Cladophialophora immunda TaxID=569365 RepID=A0A0D2CXW2_9EURO|nr:uncharacterized protein PV07_08100 [Cladophialophora immunda]KIW28434.1 hypothetical protein PV07_08100 [Cladophialophora immunda]